MFRKLAPHAVIVLCAMYLVFFCIDRVNATMAFIDNDITKFLLLALCALAVWESVTLIREDRRREAARLRRRPAATTRRPR